MRSLAQLARLLERATGELGLAHYRVLSAIASGEERASRVAERFGLGRPTVSAAVDALSRQGLLARVGSSTDQRAVDLRLTGEGRRVLRGVEAEMVQVLGDLCDRLEPPATAQAILSAVGALGAALDARRAERLARHRGRAEGKQPVTHGRTSARTSATS